MIYTLLLPFRTYCSGSVTFYTLELLEDNQGNTKGSTAFYLYYYNNADIHLGANAPIDKFIAKPLGQ